MDIEAILDMAVDMAPEYSTAKTLFADLNERIENPKQWSTWRKIVSDHPEHNSRIRKSLKRAQLHRQEQPRDFDIEKYFELQLEAAAEWKKQHQDNTRMEIRIDSDAPVGVVFTSDWHVGGPGTEHLQIREDNSLISEHPQLFAYVGGDWADNFVIPALSHAGQGSVFEAGDQQYEIVRYLLEILGYDSILAISDGNHTDWSKRMSGIDPRMHLLRQTPSLYTSGGSLLKLTVGSQQYRIFRRHRHRWSSVFNPGHAVVSEYQRGKFDFDVGVIEHQHQPFIGTFDGHEREDLSTDRIAVRTGTYKVSDSHAALHGYAFSSTNMPCVVFFPDTFRMIPLLGIENAIDFLDSQ